MTDMWKFRFIEIVNKCHASLVYFKVGLDCFQFMFLIWLNVLDCCRIRFVILISERLLKHCNIHHSKKRKTCKIKGKTIGRRKCTFMQHINNASCPSLEFNRNFVLTYIYVQINSQSFKHINGCK